MVLTPTPRSPSRRRFRSALTRSQPHSQQLHGSPTRRDSQARSFGMLSSSHKNQGSRAKTHHQRGAGADGQ